MSERKVTVASSSGLHARPAALFAEAAGKVGVEVTIAMDGAPSEDAMDASSILSLMTLGAEHGSVVVLRADGDGADAALDELAAMLATDLDAV